MKRFEIRRGALGVVLMIAAVLSGCALTRPSPWSSASPSRSRGAPGAGASSQPGPAPLSSPAPGSSVPPVPAPRRFQLGAAAASLVRIARAQQRSGNFPLAAETLERALSIEPHNPLVWIELGKETLAAGQSAQAYGLGRKALYLATGDSSAQASAWGLIAAALRAEGRNQAALAAERKAAELSVN